MEEKSRKTLPPEEIAMFCEQVALILKSGIPLFDGIDALCQNYKETKYGERFMLMNDKVKETGSLYEALEAVGVFPSYMVNTVKIGEQAGTVDSVMDSMSRYYAREAKIRHAVKNAITYPVVLIAMMALVVGVLVVKVLPVFTQVFRNLGTDMSASSMAIMSFGLQAGKAVLIAVCALPVAGGVLFFLSRTKKRDAVMKFLSTIFSPVQELFSKTAAARFSSVMSMMMSSGFPLESALSLIPDVLNDNSAKAKVEVCKKLMEEGESFPSAVEASGIFEGIHVKMVRVGFMAGQLDGVMDKLADIYNEDIDNAISRMVSLIEPTLVGILSVIIGAILLAVMLPLASILSSM